jgi:hypothetical protein
MINKNIYTNMFLTNSCQQLTAIFAQSIRSCILYQIKFNVLFFIFLNAIFFQQLLSADEAGYKAALAQLNAITDRIPSDDDFFRICQEPEIKLSDKEQSKFWLAIVRLQKTQIDIKTLVAIFKARRDSLSQCKISYSEIIQNPANSKHGPEGRTSRDYVFAFSKNRYYLERTEKRGADDYEHSIISYDGNAIILVALPKNDIPRADITEANSFKSFFQSHIPLFYTRHLEEYRFDESINNKDILGMMEIPGMPSNVRQAWVFQQERMINGSKCITVGTSARRFYLDVERDYSIVRTELFLNRLIASNVEISRRCDLFDYIDDGNGNWFPSKIEETRYTDGKPDAFTTIVVRDVQTKNIPDSFFSDVIPENAFVFDGIRKMTYMQSDKPSIGSLSKETVKNKLILVFRYVSVISGLTLIFIAILLKYRAYRKNKRERENKTEEIK